MNCESSSSTDEGQLSSAPLDPPQADPLGDGEAAMIDLGIQAAMYPTWKSGGVHGMRWRVIVPLARPVPGGAYKAVWVPVARAIERGLYSQGCFRPEHGWIDWSGKTVT